MDFKIDYISTKECPGPYPYNHFSNCQRCDYFQKLTMNNNTIKVVCTYLEWNQETEYNKHDRHEMS